MKFLQTIETHPIGTILLSTLFILWWYGVWGLMDEAAKAIHTKYDIPYHTIYLVCFFGVILCIPLFPTLLEKF